MRILKTLMFLMLALLVLALAVVGYFYATAKVTVEKAHVEGVSAAAQPEVFERIREAVAQDAFEGTVFREADLSTPEQYALITYTLRLNNQCLVPIDMIEVQVVPDPKDVLQARDDTVHSLDAKTQGDITALLLTTSDSHAIRELIVTYYVWGVSFSLRSTYGG